MNKITTALMLLLLMMNAACGTTEEGPICLTVITPSLFVTVTDDETGEVITDATVYVNNEADPSDVNQELTLNSDDEYQIDILGGTYTLIVERPGYETHSQEVIMTGSECYGDYQGIEVELETAETLFSLNVTVMTEDEDVIYAGSTEIFVTTEDGDVLSLAVPECDDNPEVSAMCMPLPYTINLPNGTYELSVDLTGEPVTQSVEVDGEDIDLDVVIEL